MKDDRTYIKIFRKMLSWEWYGDTNTFRVFMHILLRANYEPSRYRGVEIPAGACVFGYNAWAKQLGLSVQQVRTAIDHLKATNEITMQSTNRFSVVTLVKWEFWQIEEGRATSKTTHKATSDQQATNKQPTTSKESKKVRNTTPTIEDVREYAREKHFVIDPDYFYEYYSAGNWKDKDGKPVLSWKQKMLTWERKEKQRGVQPNNRANDGNSRKAPAAQRSSGSGARIVGARLPPMVPGLEEEE